jgi:DNA helicase II / ATP-dependent DNA helicase PcrA
MPHLGKIFEIYSKRCFGANAMDFDDLLFNTNVLFRDHLDVLNKYQHKFKYVMVDEFQDTNMSQYLITRRLSAVHQNICVVGDDAQSIYAFRGADIQNILNFRNDYPDLKVVKLEQNYRSTQTIVNAANSIIKKNKSQLPKNVFSENESGDRIKVLKASTDNEEGKSIAHLIFETKLNEGYSNSDFAILYRTNSQSRAFEEALRKINIKYRIIGGLSFYQRKEIKDLLAYLRFIVNQKDEEAFKRIINYPKRGIGDTTIARIVVAASENQMSIWDICLEAAHYLDSKTALKITDFIDLIKSYILKINKGENAHDVAQHVAKTTGIMHELFVDKTVEGKARYDNLQELLSSMKQFVENPEIDDKSLESFLQTVALLTNADQEDDDPDKVTMMTVHGSKGLEFKYVFVVGMEEQLFPSTMMAQTLKDLEEERRLFYVALTRAEKKLTLSYAEQRYTWGRLVRAEPSRFISEINADFLNLNLSTSKTKADFLKNDSAFDFDHSKTVKPKPKIATQKIAHQLKPTVAPKPSSGATYVPPLNFQGSDTSLLKVGDKVEHQSFGFGTVKKIEAFSGTKKATVFFEEQGEKTLLLSFAKLKIHS